MLVDLRYKLSSGGRYVVRMYRSMERWSAEALIFMARQQGLDQSHMDVNGAREFCTRTAIPPEWERAREAFLRTMAKWW